MEKILLNDLQRHNGRLLPELQAAISRVLERSWYILGPEVERFEAEFAAWCGVESCIGVANGTDALELALRAVGIGPGDEVATVANAGGYSTTAIRAISAVPLYIDVDAHTLTMSAAALAAALTHRTRAVVVTHLYGQLADVSGLSRAAETHSIPVIEDCAQAHGAQRDGRRVGSFGHAGCFSFYPTKNLGALGDGGAVVTSNAETARKLRQLRQYGWREKYTSELAGGRNSRLDEIQAAILRVKLPQLDEWNATRRRIAQRYNAAIGGTPLRAAMIGPMIAADGQEYVAHLYVLRTERRAELRQHLAAAGIATDVHYPIPDHQQTAQAGHPWIAEKLSTTEQVCAQVTTLPCFPEMTEAEIERVSAALSRFPRATPYARPIARDAAHC